MKFDPIIASENIKRSYIDYITTGFSIADATYAADLRRELEKEGFVAKGPYLDVQGSFASGDSLNQLMEKGEASLLYAELEKDVSEKDRELKLKRPLYLHQEEALRKANAGENLIITTGTGSGKTECFLLPIIDALLREKERGTLDSAGVRAIIIYPMNALANDQIKRMRKLLRGYSDITFGLYNGNTPHADEEATKQYRRNNANGQFPEPLANEILSREKMQREPPHILITNYSMLEYMLLRPKDDAVFAGAQLRYVVLDEAHIYKGTTGMETSMLMRRLRARIQATNVQFILTSATLGGEDANEDIVSFGNNLCGVEFSTDSIIRSRVSNPEMRERQVFPIDLFHALAQQEQSVQDVLNDYGIEDFAPNGDKEEKIYELLLHSDLFYRFRNATQGQKTIGDLQRELGLSPKDFSDFVCVCTMAEKEGTCLVKAKYHFFVRALEGAYITLGSSKQLFLERKKESQGQAVFEIAVCKDCGRIAIVGKNASGCYAQVSRKSEFDPNECEFFLLWNEAELGNISLEDEGEEIEQQQGGNDFVVCSKCGAIRSPADLRFGGICDCEDAEYVPVRRVNRSQEKRIAKCPACGAGRFRSFYLGSDAATAVLCTELFEQLPEIESVQAEREAERPQAIIPGNPFANVRNQNRAIQREQTRQFLCFSDSRSEAAFFANYLEKTYLQFLRRRGIYKVAQQMQQNGEYSLSVRAFADRLTRMFAEKCTFKFWTQRGQDDWDALREESRHQAWLALLNELVNARGANSLVSLGVLNFEYTPNTPDERLDLPSYFHDFYGMSKQEGRSLIELLVMDGCYTGAINAGDQMILNDTEREFIFFAPSEKKLVRCRQAGERGNNSSGWAARARQNGGFYQNARLVRLTAATGMTEQEANNFLSEYWNYLAQEHSAGSYSFNICDFKIRLNCDTEVHTYRCKKCGCVTVHNVRGRCAIIRCNGELEEINPTEYFANNHYMRLYQSEQMRPLQVKEHTAQLSRERQTAYQEAFVTGRINALSCSTTFEMGVDVGGLETVCMRDVPPSPANYVQRAGRAGRAAHTAAFVLTYAKLSSHDFAYYAKPEAIISGEIRAPHFSMENKKVIYRHIFAVALSAFLAENEDVYNGDNANIFLNGYGANGDRNGYDRLVAFLEQPNDSLQALLEKSVPQQMHRVMGLHDGSWKEALIEDNGVLSTAVERYRRDVAALKTELERVKLERPRNYPQVELELRRLRCGENDKFQRSLIDFWTRSNVLPKYGFPVDTVELQIAGRNGQNNDEALTLARDLQMAIAEYAPGSGVIADGKLYTSRYIRLESDNHRAAPYGYFAVCPNRGCTQVNFTSRTDPGATTKCISCGQDIPRGRWSKTMEPRLGFITEKAEPRDAPLKRPEKDYKTEDFYVGDPDREVLETKCFEVNRRQVEIQSTANDSLVVIGKSRHKVCPTCGWTSNAEDDFTVPHNTSWGADCYNRNQNKCYELYLSHVFKTDVVKLSFLTQSAGNYETMLSVMFAILEGLSRSLDIERTDIKGCLHRRNWNGCLIFSIVLYDAVAGGAGHVRRLVSEDGQVLANVIQAAYRLVNECTCQPSCYQCLRNYYNQRVHDSLNRVKAAEFLQAWLGQYTAVATEGVAARRQRPTVERQEAAELGAAVQVQLQGAERVADSYTRWEEFFSARGFEEITNGAEWDEKRINRDCLLESKIRMGEQEINVDLAWQRAKLAMVVPLPERSICEALEAQGWQVFDHTIDLDTLNEMLERGGNFAWQL